MKKRENGSILFLVLIVFTIVLILGMSLLTKVQYSHKYAITHTEKQQAYYVAKSFVDIGVKYVKETSETDFNTFLGTYSNIWSDIDYFRDATNRVWECKVKFKKDVINPDYVIVTANVKNSNVEKELKGIVELSDSSIDNSFNSNNVFRINSNNKIDIQQDIAVDAAGFQGIDIICKDELLAKNISTSNPVKIKITRSDPVVAARFEAEEVLATTEDIDIDVDGDVELTRIYAAKMIDIDVDALTVLDTIHSQFNIKIVVDGELKAKSINSPYPVEIIADIVNVTDSIGGVSVKIRANNINVGSINSPTIDVKKRDGSFYDISSIVTTNVAPSVPTRTMPSPTTPSISGITIKSESDITVYKGVGDTLMAQYTETTGLVTELKETILSPGIAYVFETTNPASSLYFGVKRTINSIAVNVDTTTNLVTFPTHSATEIQTVGLDGGDCQYKLYTDPSNNFFNVVFIDNKNINYCGAFTTNNAGTGGVVINGDTTGLVFGTPSSGFIKYED